MGISILLADDHPVVRQGMRALLEVQPDIEIVGEAASGLEALRLTERLKPNLLLLDLMMPGLSGLEVTRQVSQRFPETRVVIFSLQADESYVLETLRAGALAYVLKEADGEEVLQAIRQAAAGRRYLSPSISERAIEAYLQKADSTSTDPYDTLTPREREVLQLVAEGQSNSEIAARLFISPRTVEDHRANLMRKLGLRNVADIVRYALRRGILPMER
jgi:DNA-binding NarL/FixJ family response regulator